MSNIFHSSRGIKGLIILVSGIISLSIISLFLFHYYWRLNRNNISVNQAKRDIIALTVTASHLHRPALVALIKENHSWLHLELAKKSWPKAPVVQANDLWNLHQQLNKQNKNIFLSIALPKQHYLNIKGHRPHRLQQNLAIAFCALVLIVALFLLCYWVIQTITTPLRGLAKAVEKFGYDIKAPPLPLQGDEEMRAVIRAFNKMQQQIRQLLEDRTQMLAAISHDLRTPITRLKLRVENLNDEKLYHKIITDLNEIEQMIASVLAFSRQQEINETPQTFDMNILLETICDDYLDAGKTVAYQNDSGTEQIYHGPLLSLKRVFSNIIDNALKYAGNCEIKLNEKNDKSIITFADTGPGIPETVLENVLQPFYRVNSARTLTIPGAGLGLSIASNIIKHLGGTLNLENETTGGLCVTIVLPKLIT